MNFGIIRLKKAFSLAVIAGAACCCLSACSISEANANKEKLKQIRVGMTKEEVRKIMGAPLEKEIYNTPDIWFYYTDPKFFDGVYTRDECTPLLFDENEQLKGWGYDYYKTELNKDPFMRRQLDVQL